jgi:hypothetical protein
VVPIDGVDVAALKQLKKEPSTCVPVVMYLFALIHVSKVFMENEFFFIIFTNF